MSVTIKKAFDWQMLSGIRGESIEHAFLTVMSRTRYHRIEWWSLCRCKEALGCCFSSSPSDDLCCMLDEVRGSSPRCLNGKRKLVAAYLLAPIPYQHKVIVSPWFYFKDWNKPAQERVLKLLSYQCKVHLIILIFSLFPFHCMRNIFFTLLCVGK